MFKSFGKFCFSLVQELRSMGTNFFQCIFGKILIRSCGLISLPLLTFYFTREEMGVYQLLLGGLGIFVEIATLGTRQYFVVDYFKHSSLYSRSSLIAKNIWVVLKVSSVLFIIVCLILIFKFDSIYWPIFVLMLAQSYFNIFNELFLMFLQFQMDFFRYNLISFFFALLQMCLVVLVVVVLQLKLIGLAVALFVAELILLTYFILKSKRFLFLLSKMRSVKALNIHKVLGLLKKSWLFVPSTLSFWLLVNIDQWMLGTMSSLDNVGLYAFAGKFPLLFDYLLSSTVILVYTPHLYKKLKDRFYESGNRNALIALSTLGLSVIGYYVSSLIVPMFKIFISENFHQSLDYISPLIFVACIRLSTHLLQLTIKYKNCVSFVLWSNIVSVIANTIMNYYWIPIYGINGCLMATVLSFVLMFVLHLAFHQYLIHASKKEGQIQHAF